jgi:hypothetical protein
MTHENTTEDRIPQDLIGLQESVRCIDAFIAEGSDFSRKMIGGHIQHIGIMCTEPHMIASGHDLAPFWEAQRRAIAFLA